MNYVVLMRASLGEAQEQSRCSKYIPTVSFRSEIPADSIVIGRYSVLPYYDELSQELALRNSRLVHDYRAHQWIADVESWACGVLEGMTPQTWTRWDSLPANTSFVVKGRTNSRKHQWATHMFAQSRSDVPTVAMRLLDDTLIRDQGLVVREYVPLRQLSEGINGLPVTNEWRTFWLVDGAGEPRLLAYGFYWQGSHPEVASKAIWTSEAAQMASEAARRVAACGPRFFVLDMAETQAGSWIVVEVNDGQMSGLSGCDADTLYRGIRTITL